jgi:hypothetical protein
VRALEPLRAEEVNPRATLLEAARQVVDVQSRYARAGVAMSQAALAGARAFETLRHYPAGDVRDRESGSQFYYHGHGSSRVPADEHGHFHLFVRREAPGRFFHLCALSLDAQGWPLRWFTTNRWVTGEDWVDADTAIAALPSFRPRAHGRLAPVATWLGAMLALHADDVAALLRRRDAAVTRHLARVPAETFFEDRRHDVLTETRVSLPRRLSQVAGLQPA